MSTAVTWSDSARSCLEGAGKVRSVGCVGCHCDAPSADPWTGAIRFCHLVCAVDPLTCVQARIAKLLEVLFYILYSILTAIQALTVVLILTVELTLRATTLKSQALERLMELLLSNTVFIRIRVTWSCGHATSGVAPHGALKPQFSNLRRDVL